MLSLPLLVSLSLLAGDGPTIQDAEFARTLEVWCADVAGPLYRPAGWLPPDVAALGAPHWLTRQAAAANLRDLSPDRLGWLVLAERHPDAEIRERARRLLDRLAVCRETHVEMTEYAQYVSPCPSCGNTGDVRWEWNWNDGLVRRDLFSAEALRGRPP